MESIYRDAYPDVFAACDFDFEDLKIKVDPTEEDSENVENV